MNPTLNFLVVLRCQVQKFLLFSDKVLSFFPFMSSFLFCKYYLRYFFTFLDFFFLSFLPLTSTARCLLTFSEIYINDFIHVFSDRDVNVHINIFEN